MTQSLVSRALDSLRDLSGTTLQDGDALRAYRLDGAVPAAAFLPATADAVARALAIAAAEGLAVVPWGGGLHQSLARPPARYDLAVDLTHLNRVLAYEPADMTISAEAGIRLSDLSDHLARSGQVLAMDPPKSDGATLGGVLAANLSGPLRCRYGTARDLVLGLRVASPDGRLSFSGSRVVKNATAYDLPKLHLGAFGTLGLIVEATLRVYPRPTAEAGWWLLTDGVDRAQTLADRILSSVLTPSRLELFDGSAGCAMGAGGAGLMASVAGIPEAVADQGRQLATLAEEEGGRIVPVTAPLAAWTAVRDFPWPPGTHDPDLVLWRSGVSPAACGRAITTILSRITGGVQTGAAASVASGTLRGYFRGDEASLIRTIAESRAALEAMGGYLVIMGAPPGVRCALDTWGPPLDGFDLMRQLRQAFDPRETLNPGRFLPGL